MDFSNDNSPVGTGSNAFREAVCIDTKRIYDSCGDKDCVRGLQVYFTNEGQPIIDAAVNIKPRAAEAVGVYFEVEPVAFHKGFYSVDMTFFFKVSVAAYNSPASAPTLVDGLATFSKKAILFGSEASVRAFSTESTSSGNLSNLPIVNVQVIDPMILATQIDSNNVPQNFVAPEAIAQQFTGSFSGFTPLRVVHISIGLFSIVQLERQVQVMVPIYDFCLPDKGSVTSTDDPCELFDKISFPTDEFFPPRLSDMSED
jgi:hypothetical protein